MCRSMVQPQAFHDWLTTAPQQHDEGRCQGQTTRMLRSICKATVESRDAELNHWQDGLRGGWAMLHIKDSELSDGFVISVCWLSGHS